MPRKQSSKTSTTKARSKSAAAKKTMAKKRASSSRAAPRASSVQASKGGIVQAVLPRAEFLTLSAARDERSPIVLVADGTHGQKPYTITVLGFNGGTKAARTKQIKDLRANLRTKDKYPARNRKQQVGIAMADEGKTARVTVQQSTINTAEKYKKFLSDLRRGVKSVNKMTAEAKLPVAIRAVGKGPKQCKPVSIYKKGKVGEKVRPVFCNWTTVQSGYNLFVKENYDRVKRTTPDPKKRFGVLGDEWKALTPAAQRGYNTRAAAQSNPRCTVRLGGVSKEEAVRVLLGYGAKPSELVNKTTDSKTKRVSYNLKTEKQLVRLLGAYQRDNNVKCVPNYDPKEANITGVELKAAMANSEARSRAATARLAAARRANPGAFATRGRRARSTGRGRSAPRAAPRAASRAAPRAAAAPRARAATRAAAAPRRGRSAARGYEQDRASQLRSLIRQYQSLQD